MTDFNPLAGAILGSGQVQDQLDIEKRRQVRKAQAARRDSAAREDSFEHQVESSDEVHPVGEDAHDHREGSSRDAKSPPKDDEPPHLDVVA